MFELYRMPAKPASRPLTAYAPQMIPRERTPASRLAAGLMPTDSVSRPSAVRRSTSAMMTTAAIDT